MLNFVKGRGNFEELVNIRRVNGLMKLNLMRWLKKICIVMWNMFFFNNIVCVKLIMVN